jgi:hypothetical protein
LGGKNEIKFSCLDQEDVEICGRETSFNPRPLLSPKREVKGSKTKFFALFPSRFGRGQAVGFYSIYNILLTSTKIGYSFINKNREGIGMPWKIVLKLFGLSILAAVIGIALYRPVIRPWHARWGATEAETQMVLPGDAIVTGEVSQTTRSMAIRSSAAQIWPWLLQLGQGRGGMYSYDFLENLVGCDIHTLNTIVPELQNLQVGDAIMMGPQEGLPFYRVVLLEPHKALVLQSINPASGASGETWGFYLIEQSNSLTRLVVRHRTLPSLDSTEQLVNGIFDPIVFLMEHRMLYGIRDHAEKMTPLASISQ